MEYGGGIWREMKHNQISKLLYGREWYSVETRYYDVSVVPGEPYC